MDLQLKPFYEDFEVHTEWVHGTADDTLNAYLPGFRKEQLKVQVTSFGNLRLSGERPIGDNKFSRFSKEVPIPSNCDLNKIRANYKGGMLHVKFSKQIAPVDGKPEKAKPLAEDPVPKSDQRAAEQAIQKGPPKAKEADKVSEQTPGKQKEIEGNGEKPADSAQKAEKYWQLGIHYERVIGGLAKGLKNPRKVMNMVLVVLLVVVLAVYVRNVIMSARNY
ncbi:hypothetical protein like AT2G27140 [Hibiscus trionum]|uniref:SHSP domain-containing protein n=1 Tax=Hibiscus trionum TaxID=183268 RepID=A0A9W7LXM4_HIBTR|nr:hypothetical protein like AT2G27140 [Hibiscus trionum]